MDGTATYLYPIDVPPLTLPASEMRFPTLQPAGTFLQQMHLRSSFADAPLQSQQYDQRQYHQQHEHASKTIDAFNSHATAASPTSPTSPTSPSSVSAAASSSFLASIRRGLDDLVHQYDDSDDDDDDEDDSDDDDDSPRYYSASSNHTYYSPPSSLSAQYGMSSAPSALLQPSALFTAHAAPYTSSHNARPRDDLIFDMEL